MERYQRTVESICASLSVTGLAMAMCFGELLFIFLHKMIVANTSIGGSFLRWGPTSICTLVSLPVAILMWTAPKQRILLVLSSICLALYIGFQFRGSFIWPGTFDNDIQGISSMIYPIIISIFLGFFVSKGLNLKVAKLKSLCILVGSISVMSVIFSSMNARLDVWVQSDFAYSRHFAMLALGICAPLATILIYKYEEEN